MTETSHVVRTASWLSILIAAIWLPVAGCQPLSGSSCGGYANDYQSAIANEGQLSSTIAEEAPYPMAIVISQDAINRLFEAIAGSELPPLTLGDEVLGVPVSVTLRPQLPLIQVGGERGCDTCVLTALDFGLDVSVDESTVSGTGSGRYQFPLTLEPNGLQSTKLLAQLGQSSVLSVNFAVSGLDTDLVDAIEPMVSEGATHIIRHTLGDTELFELSAWTIGNGDVKLLGRGPLIYPETGTVAMGFHTNLVRPLSGSVEVEPSLPPGADLGMQFHPELVQQMIRRMMQEGHIDREYDVTGQTQPGGGFSISLDRLSGAENDLLRSDFTLWRTSGGLCGTVGLQADLGLSLSDREIQLDIENLTVTDSSGIGDYLIAVDQWLSSPFLSSLMTYSELTLNYREIDLPDGKRMDMSANTFSLDLGSSGLSIYLNIDAIVGSD